jgi:hypothetical protein
LVLVALGALAVGGLGIAVTLATTDSAKWPAWLRPYQGLGWWAVLGSLLVVVVLSVWQYTHQEKGASGGASATSVRADDDGPAVGQDVIITGGLGQTAARDIVNIGLLSPAPPEATSVGDVRWPTPDKPIANLGPAIQPSPAARSC